MELEETRGLISSGENDKERTYYLSTPSSFASRGIFKNAYALVEETEKRLVRLKESCQFSPSNRIERR